MLWWPVLEAREYASINARSLSAIIPELQQFFENLLDTDELLDVFYY